MVSVEIVALVLTGLGLAASIIYYANILQNANKTQQIQLGTRQTQLFMYLYDKWSGETFSKNWYECMSWNWTDYENYREKYVYNVDKDAFAGFQSIIGFFEGLGVLVKDGEIRTSLVEDLMSRQIIEFWEKFEPIFLEYRIRYNYPNACEWLEYLYNQIKPIYEQQHPELST